MAVLAVTYDSLREAIGYFLGYGRTTADWSSEQSANVRAALDAGYRMFLTPPAAPGRRSSYQWSFLRPVLDIALVSDLRDYPLPDGFVCFEGELHVVTTNTVYARVNRRTIGEILQLRAEAGSVTGRPYCVAVRPRSMDGAPGLGQRFELMVYPTPEASYTLRGQAQISPPALSSDNPYPYGGTAHGETIRQACLAAAERDVDDAPQAGHQAAFLQCLAASIDADARLRPSNLGRSRDESPFDPNSVVYATWSDVLYEG